MFSRDPALELPSIRRQGRTRVGRWQAGQASCSRCVLTRSISVLAGRACGSPFFKKVPVPRARHDDKSSRAPKLQRDQESGSERANRELKRAPRPPRAPVSSRDGPRLRLRDSRCAPRSPEVPFPARNTTLRLELDASCLGPAPRPATKASKTYHWVVSRAWCWDAVVLRS